MKTYDLEFTPDDWNTVAIKVKANELRIEYDDNGKPLTIYADHVEIEVDDTLIAIKERSGKELYPVSTPLVPNWSIA